MVAVVSHPPADIETTYTIDICKPLKVPQNVPKNEYCPNGTRGGFGQRIWFTFVG